MCSILEAVLLSTPMSFITMREREGAKNASLMMKQKQNIDRPISAILSLNTIAHTVGSAGVGAEAVKVFGEAYFGIISAVLNFVILVLSEIFTKTIGSYYWRQLAMPASKIIHWMVIVSYPLVWISERITNLIASKKQPLSVSREEVSAMVSVGTKEGVFEASESDMVQNIFNLKHIALHEIMTPRTVVITAKESTKLKEFHANKMHGIFSRIPIYSDNPDFITGFVLKQTVLERMAEDDFNKSLADIKRPILSFNEDTSVSIAWEEMLKRKQHIAQIQNEYGCFLGVVTMEDIIETIIGREIVDESDAVADLQAYAREKWQKQIK